MATLKEQIADVKRMIEEIDLQIIVVKGEALRLSDQMGHEIHYLKLQDTTGSFMMAPLLVVRANLALALIELEKENTKKDFWKNIFEQPTKDDGDRPCIYNAHKIEGVDDELAVLCHTHGQPPIDGDVANLCRGTL